MRNDSDNGTNPQFTVRNARRNARYAASITLFNCMYLYVVQSISESLSQSFTISIAEDVDLKSEFVNMLIKS